MAHFIHSAMKTLSDPWVIFGLLSQGVFFCRFIVQWYLSEKKKQVVVPLSFWYISIIGTVMILIYSFHIHDFVFIAASWLSFIIYIRNIVIHTKDQRLKQNTDTVKA